MNQHQASYQHDLEPEVKVTFQYTGFFIKPVTIMATVYPPTDCQTNLYEAEPHEDVQFWYDDSPIFEVNVFILNGVACTPDMLTDYEKSKILEYLGKNWESMVQ